MKKLGKAIVQITLALVGISLLVFIVMICVRGWKWVLSFPKPWNILVPVVNIF